MRAIFILLSFSISTSFTLTAARPMEAHYGRRHPLHMVQLADTTQPHHVSTVDPYSSSESHMSIYPRADSDNEHPSSPRTDISQPATVDPTNKDSGECGVCLQDKSPSEMKLVCPNSHSLCITCAHDPRIKICPNCRGPLLPRCPSCFKQLTPSQIQTVCMTNLSHKACKE